MIQTPRERFLTSGHRAEMEKISISDAFLTACDSATLIFADELSNPLDQTAQAQLVGARRVLAILKEIHQKSEPPKQIKSNTLNYSTVAPPRP